MKYESTILKRLIDTYGVVGNPRYISEIIKEFIVRGKERFPELFTYQADWLEHIDEFGLNPSYTVSYTGQSIYAPNTLERPVKSAILKGQTLVNLMGELAVDLNNNSWSEDENNYNLDLATGNGQPILSFKTLYDLPANKTYTLFINMTSYTSGVLHIEFRTPKNTSSSSNQRYFGKAGWQKLVFTTTEETGFVRMFNRNSVDNTFSIGKSLILLEGDHTNTPIPNYFTGMASVQMPGLTTIGKNLLNPLWKKEYGKFCPFNLKKGTTLTLSTKDSIPSLGGNLLFTTVSGREKWFPIDAGATKNTITLNEDVYQVKNILQGKIEYQLEIGSVATSYEPYKSNILTVNEDVELRGIGEVQDTLDCLTGEVIERIGEISALNALGWSDVTDSYFPSETYRTFMTTLSSMVGSKAYPNVLCNVLPYLKSGYSKEKISISTYQNKLYIKLLKVDVSSVNELKQWLSESSSSLQYELKQPSIKTVDLTIKDHNGQNVKQLMSFNGGTHFNTRSSEGSLLPTVSTSVETDLEETLKMCSLDGNTM